MAEVSRVSTVTLILSDTEASLIQACLALVEVSNDAHTKGNHCRTWINGEPIRLEEAKMARELNGLIEYGAP